ncbi:Aps3 protein [Starmerella bacillaris]|uniref:Aps3 protein n=1 Tax=Starmerella bacillaris TaxID=1247836 RepID=A0AAV5RHQ2_STABA|nr:Aps3 protein [Starmerella bacillaris]
MIHSVLIINNLGNPRLSRFYTPVSLQEQQHLIKQIYELLLQRNLSQSNVLVLPELLQGADGEDETVRVIYKSYATLNFVFIVDEQESELGVLDLIHEFVAALDKCFGNVCELDLVFGWEVLESVLEELIQGGLVLETNSDRIVQAVDSANKQVFSGSKPKGLSSSSGSWSLPTNEDAINVATRAFSNASDVLKSFLPSSK